MTDRKANSSFALRTTLIIFFFAGLLCLLHMGSGDGARASESDASPKAAAVSLDEKISDKIIDRLCPESEDTPTKFCCEQFGWEWICPSDKPDPKCRCSNVFEL